LQRPGFQWSDWVSDITRLRQGYGPALTEKAARVAVSEREGSESQTAVTQPQARPGFQIRSQRGGMLRSDVRTLVVDGAFHPRHLLGDFLNVFLDGFNVWMQFGEDGVFFLRDFFDPLRLISQLLEHCILPRRDSVHPPKANAPATNVGYCDSVEKKARHRELKWKNKKVQPRNGWL
jgi:hypothetical protein